MIRVSELWKDDGVRNYTFSSKSISTSNGTDIVRINNDIDHDLWYDFNVGKTNLSAYLETIKYDSVNETHFADTFVLRVETQDIKNHVSLGEYDVGMDPNWVTTEATFKPEKQASPKSPGPTTDQILNQSTSSAGTVYASESPSAQGGICNAGTAGAGFMGPNGDYSQTGPKGLSQGAPGGAQSTLHQETNKGILSTAPNFIQHYLIDMAKSVMFIPMEDVPDLISIFNKARFMVSIGYAARTFVKDLNKEA